LRIKRHEVGTEIRGEQIFPAAGYGIRPIEFRNRGFLRRRFRLRQHRNLIAASCARSHATVRQKLFTHLKAGLFARPVNVVAPAIRKIDKFWLIYLNQPRTLIVKTLVMFGDKRIMGGGALQFVSRPHPTRHN
jgi:hypothetical protein